MEILSRSPQECPPGVCAQRNFNTVECDIPFTAEVPLLPALPLAEELCPRAVQNNLNSKRDYETGADIAIRSAWAHVERALQLSPGNSDAEKTFTLAGATTSRVGSRAPAHQKANAAILRAYLGAFRKRQAGEQFESADFYGLREDLAGISTFISEKVHNEDGRMASILLGQVAFLGLTLRRRVLVYPASSREQDKRMPFDHHHAYIISKQQKIPIRVRLHPSNEEHRSPLREISVIDIRRQVRAELPEVSKYPRLAGLCRMIRDDLHSTNRTNHRARIRFLNAMADKVHEAIDPY